MLGLTARGTHRGNPDEFRADAEKNGIMPNLPVRVRTDAKLAGVCAALARAWSIDPVIVRVAFVLLAFFTNGFIIAAYAALWALLPERGGQAPLHQLFPATRSWSWPTLVTVVVLVTATVGAAVSGSGPGAFVVLVLAWVILRFGLAGRRTPEPPAASAPLPPPTTPFERVALAWQQRLDNLENGRPADWVPQVEAASSSLYSPAAGPVSRRSPAVRRRGARTWLGVGVGVGSAWTGLAIASALGVVVEPLAWAASALLVLAATLVWSARPARAAYGRPRFLLPLAILVGLGTIPLLTPVAAPTVANVTAPVAMPGTVQNLPIGENVIDLAASPTADETLRYRLDLGDVEVRVPREGNVVVNAHVDLGEIKTPSGDREGMDLDHTWSRVDDPAAPTRTIEVEVGLGEVVVRP